MPNTYLIAIKSCHKHADRRKAVNETWLPRIDWAETVFLLGQPQSVIPDALSCNVSDEFANIAPKILCAARYAAENNIERMFVCDDDTYVCAPRLRAAALGLTAEYVGFLRTSGLFYNKEIPYAQGSAYWLGPNAIDYLANAQALLVPGIIDDGAVGQALIDRVPFTHDYRYTPGPEPEVPTVKNNVITCHKCLPDVMRRVHKAAQKVS